MNSNIKIGLLIAILFTLIISYTIFKLNDNNMYSNKTEKTKLVFSYGGNDYNNIFENNIKQFEETHPEIEIEIQQLDNDPSKRFKKYKEDLKVGNNTIDAFYADIAWIFELAEMSLILPLENYFEKTEQEKFLSNTIEACTYKDNIYAIPSRTDTSFLYYRTDIVEKPPKTYDEMIKIAKENMDYPGIESGYIFQGYTYEGLVCNALEFIWNNGGDVLNGDKITINSQESIDGLQKLVDICNLEITNDSVFSFKEDESLVAFQNGTAIFMRNWPYAFNELKSDKSKIKKNVGVAPLPLGTKGTKSIGTIGGWNYVINKNSKNPDKTWTFIEWMSNYENQVIDSKYGFIPTRKEVFNNEEVLIKNSLLKDFKEVIPNSKSRPFSKNYSKISDSLQKNFKAAIQNKITSNEAIRNIENDLKNYLGRNKN